MSNFPALQSQQSVQIPSIPSEHEMMVYHTMAEQAVSSKMYRGIGEKAGVMMIMLAARELGISPMQALNGGLNIIQGKVEISARMMNALIRRAGHQITIKESTDDSCTLAGKRADNGDTATVTYTVAEAQKAGLVKQGGAWTKIPKDMCFARALSRLARQLYSDVIGIGYIEGEIAQSTLTPVERAPVEEPKEVTGILMPASENVNLDALESYAALFDPADQQLALDYLVTVKKHFGWSTEEAAHKMMDDKTKLLEKFNLWKAKSNAV